jgi:hypothetical protein
MNEIIGRIDSLECGGQAFRIEKIGPENLDIASPRSSLDPIWIAHQDTNLMAFAEEFWNQSAADIAGGTRDEDLHLT